MRRSLAWSLVATAILSVATLWTESDHPRLVAAVNPRKGEQALSLEVVAPREIFQLSNSNASLPAELPALVPQPARRDVFEPKVATLPAPGPAIAVVASAPAEPTPVMAPPLNLRFLGSMIDPSGKRLVYLARGDIAVLVGTGDRLDEGYVVESLTRDAIVLVYPALNARTTVPIPPEPQQ